MNIKEKILTIIVLLGLIICDGIYIKYIVKDELSDNIFTLYKGKKCGIVIDNFTDLHNIKHGTRTDYFLKVQYGANVVTEEVTSITFHNNYKIGTNICLNIYEQVPFIICLSIIITAILLIVLLFAWILH